MVEEIKLRQTSAVLLLGYNNGLLVLCIGLELVKPPNDCIFLYKKLIEMKLGKYGIFVALIEVSGDTGRIGLHIMADLNFGYIGSP